MTATGDVWSQIGRVDDAGADRHRRQWARIAQLAGSSLLVAVLAVRVGLWLAAPVSVVAIALVALGQRSETFAALTRLIDRAAAAVAAAVRTVLLTALWLLLVLVPWLLQRVVHWDPTWTPRRRGSRWVGLVDGPSSPGHMWATDRRSVRSTPGRRLHRVVAGLLVIVLLGACVGGWLWTDQLHKEHLRYSVPALANEPWWPEISDAVDMTYGQSPLSSFVGGTLMRDARFPGFNVTDHQRHTWRPPASTCEPVVVWAFGGSTMFGLGQRDDHTIPSELARTAWRHGIALEVHNWGVPADMFWMETRRLELALSEGNPPPDLVVFYDGANDFRVQANMNGHGRGGKLFFPNDLDATALADIQRDNERLSFLMALTRTAPELAPDSRAYLTPEEVGTRGAAAYTEAAKLVEPVLASRGIPWVQFYQPSRVTRRVPLASERSPDTDDAYWRTVEPVFRAHLSPHVIDLSDAMDSTNEPVYYDELHTNELGARVVADAIYERLEPQLAAASSEANRTRSCR